MSSWRLSLFHTGNFEPIFFHISKSLYIKKEPSVHLAPGIIHIQIIDVFLLLLKPLLSLGLDCYWIERNFGQECQCVFWPQLH